MELQQTGSGQLAVAARAALHTPVPLAAPDAARIPSGRWVAPAVTLFSLIAHGLVLVVAALVPPPPTIVPAPTEVALEIVSPPPAPQLEAPREVPAMPAAIVPRPRPRIVRAAPAAPAMVMTAEGSTGSTFTQPAGQPDGQLGGVPNGTGTGTANEISREDLRRILLGYIRNTLSRFLDGRINYPLAARREHREGVVLLRIRLARDGRILAVRLSRSSGHGSLDQAALASVQSLGSMPAPPRQIPWDDAQELPLPVTYELE